MPGEIDLAGELLTWSARSAYYKHARPSMLADFVRLCDADDAAILSYARKWGVLNICEHGLPCSHNQYPYGLIDGVKPCLPQLLTPLPAQGSDFRFGERLEHWRVWSRKAKALMTIGSHLNRRKLPRYGDWEVIKGFCESPWETESRPYMKSLASARKELAWEVDHWIALSQVRPRISWNETVADWRCSLDALCTGPNLFGVLAVYLIGAIAAPGRGIAICSSCAQPYIPERRPDPNRNNYCRHCQGKSGKQAARRDAARRFRAKQRGRKLP